jgi:hypothetical protein
MRKLIALAVVLVLILGGCDNATKRLVVEWTPPDSGESPTSYIVEVFDGDTWTELRGTFESDTKMTFKYSVGEILIVRVAAIDRFNRQSDWSEPSDRFFVGGDK